MKYGVCDWILGGTDDAARFSRAKSLGLDGIEINLPLRDLANPAGRVEELKRLAGSTGLAIPSMCIGEHNGKGLIANVDRGGAVSDEIAAAIDCCAAVGAATLLVPFFGSNEPRNFVQRRDVAEKLRPLCRRAEQCGVVIAFEGTLPAAQMAQMAHRIASPAFGVYFDLANCVWVDQDGPREIRELGSLVRQVHMKESRYGTGDARPGDGRVNYPESARALREIGYDGWLVLETPNGTDEQVRADLAFTRQFWEQSSASGG